MNQEPIFIGYFPKRVTTRPDWLQVPNVCEICSVSNCISPGPTNWVQAWKHNAWGMYDTPELASQIAQSNSAQYSLFAYKLFPFRWLGDKPEDFFIAPPPASLPPTWRSLGYDIVTRTVADFFECSPLSCNHAAGKYAVNEFCLIENYADACRALEEISKDGHYEPGP